MLSVKFFFAFLIFNISIFVCDAQTKPKAKTFTVTPITKFKPPTVKTFLGKNQDNAVVTVDEAKQLIGLPLKITDAKNVAYNISSYQFLYKKKSVIQNEETGRKEIAFTTVADLFKTTPLPQIWVTNIADNGMQKDEEIYFFDIIVTDKLNRKFFAPNIKIRIQ
jgi:hypothetical protein